MATLLQSINFRPPTPSAATTNTGKLIKSTPFCVRFANNMCYTTNYSLFSRHNNLFSNFATVPKFITLSSSGETLETETETETEPEPEQQQPPIQDTTEGAVVDGEPSEESSSDDGKSEYQVLYGLRMYKKALDSNDEDEVRFAETFLKTIEEERNFFKGQVTSLVDDLTVERERVLRISADFDNFRKRTERERLSLVSNAQGELIENFLPVLDNFLRAKSQLKLETEGEKKIDSSYQSIYKQFSEILNSVGVVPVETVGKEFDPMLHEAIMREESTDYDEDIVIEEFRKGFKLGERLLRPSMVKVSAGPGPEKSEQPESSVQEEGVIDTKSEVVAEVADSGDQTSS